jgi:hypothetical protein
MRCNKPQIGRVDRYNPNATTPTAILTGLLLAGLAGLANADPVAIIWNGPAVETPDCGGGFPCGQPSADQITQTLNGPAADLGLSYATGLTTNPTNWYDSAGSPFLISSDTEVELNVSANINAGGSNCNPGRCVSGIGWTYSVAMSGYGEIINPSDFTVELRVPFTYSATVPGVCQTYPPPFSPFL